MTSNADTPVETTPIDSVAVETTSYEEPKGVFVSSELERKISARLKEKRDYFTQTDDYPKAFRAGKCETAGKDKAKFEILLFWRTNEENIQREIEVDDLADSGGIDDDVERLNVAVNDTVAVRVPETQRHLPDPIGLPRPRDLWFVFILEQSRERSALLDVLGGLDELVSVPCEHVSRVDQVRVSAEHTQTCACVR